MLKTIFESFPTLSSPAFIWQQRLGIEKFTSLKKHWLRPDEFRPESHFCPKCNGVHRIHWHSDSDIVSVPPNDVYCDKHSLSFEDACFLRFDVPRFVEQLCQQLSIILDKKADFSRFPCRIGWVEGALRQYPVYLLLGDPSRAEQAAKNLLVEEESPFVLISSSDLPELFPLFEKQKCRLLSLLLITEITQASVDITSIGRKLFSDFLGGAEDSGCNPVEKSVILKALEDLRAHIDHRLDNVGHKFADMEAENDRLKGELSKVIAHIASQVDSEYFRWIYTVLALGSISKASVALKIPNSTFSKSLKDGAGRGTMYRTLYSMIARRKGCGRKSVEGYNPEFAEHQGTSYDDPDVIKDLLSGLETLNAKNWPKVRDELIELVQAELM